MTNQIESKMIYYSLNLPQEAISWTSNGFNPGCSWQKANCKDETEGRMTQKDMPSLNDS